MDAKRLEVIEMIALRLSDESEDAEDFLALRDLARCAREYGQQLWRREGPRWMKCPSCKKDGFCRLDVWEPFNKTSKCKCRKCGEWATIDQWTAIEAVEAAEGKI